MPSLDHLFTRRSRLLLASFIGRRGLDGRDTPKKVLADLLVHSVLGLYRLKVLKAPDTKEVRLGFLERRPLGDFGKFVGDYNGIRFHDRALLRHRRCIRLLLGMYLSVSFRLLYLLGELLQLENVRDWIEYLLCRRHKVKRLASSFVEIQLLRQFLHCGARRLPSLISHRQDFLDIFQVVVVGVNWLIPRIRPFASTSADELLCFCV